MNHRIRSSKIDLTPRRYHGYAVLLFIFGTLFPPLAVAARFGIGGDFWLNILLTICGYIPGHFHNFYIQNIRNNKTHSRTPKLMQRYGLVDTSEIERNERRSRWARRFNERTAHSDLDGRPYEEGQIGSGSSINLGQDANRAQRDGLWNPSEENFYGQNGDSSSVATSGSGGRWHYPANFDDAEPVGPARKKSKKRDRFERTAAANMATSAAQDSGRVRRRKSKKRKSAAAPVDVDTYSRRSDSSTEFPEDPEGGLYGDRRPPRSGDDGEGAPRLTDDDVVFNHQL